MRKLLCRCCNYKKGHFYLRSLNKQLHAEPVFKTYSALVPVDVSFLFSEEVQKSTPPSPMLGAGAVAAAAAAEVAKRVPKFKPPPAPRVVCPKPLTTRKTWLMQHKALGRLLKIRCLYFTCRCGVREETTTQ